MKNNDQNFLYSEKEYESWKKSREFGENDTKEVYITWRIHRDKKNEESSKRINELFKEAEEKESKMDPEELKALNRARRHHSRKVRSEILGYEDIGEKPNTKEENADTNDIK